MVDVRIGCDIVANSPYLEEWLNVPKHQTV